jgi:cystathionine beta-lyase
LGLASVEVPLLFQNGRASLDLPALDAAAEHGLEAVILCNPQNPLGTCFTRAELAALGELAQRRNLLVLSDEIWADLIHAGNRYVPATSVPELAPRCVSFHAFSKTFSMPSTGFSWACIPDSGLRSELEQRLAGLNPEANTFGRAAALAAATQGEAWLEETLALLARNRALAARFALEVLGQSEGATPEAGTFAWLDFRSTPFADAPQARLLETARVALSAGTDFGTQGRGYARLNFACPTPRLREALDRIAKALHSPFDPRP